MEIAIALLQHYSFDLGGYTISDLTRAWSNFKPEWVRQAVIEALFQGRYKAVSVNQILYLWDRKGESNCRYSHEFERLVCGDVAVIYEDRIFYTPPQASKRESSAKEIAPFDQLLKPNPSIAFPRRSIFGSVNNPKATNPKPQKYPNRVVNPSGTTAPSKVYPSPSKSNYSEIYLSAYENMTSRAESAMFVDKLRSMCGDRLVLPVPEIPYNPDKLEVSLN